MSSVSAPSSVSVLSSTAHLTSDEQMTMLRQRQRELEEREVASERELRRLRNRAAASEAKSDAALGRTNNNVKLLKRASGKRRLRLDTAWDN